MDRREKVWISQVSLHLLPRQLRRATTLLPPWGWCQLSVRRFVLYWSLNKLDHLHYTQSTLHRLRSVLSTMNNWQYTDYTLANKLYIIIPIRINICTMCICTFYVVLIDRHFTLGIRCGTIWVRIITYAILLMFCLPQYFLKLMLILIKWRKYRRRYGIYISYTFAITSVYAICYSLKTV